MRSSISGMCAVARGMCSGRSRRSVAMSSSNALTYSAVKAPRSAPASWAFWMIRSSTSVKFMTSRTLYPKWRSVRRSTSVATNDRKLPTCARLYTVGPQA